MSDSPFRTGLEQAAVAFAIAAVICLIGLISRVYEENEPNGDVSLWQLYRLLRKAKREHLILHIKAKTEEGSIEVIGEVRNVASDKVSLRSMILRRDDNTRSYQRRRIEVPQITSVRICGKQPWCFVYDEK